MALTGEIPGMRRFADPDERRELVSRLLVSIGSGTPAVVAANYSGITVETLRRWIKDGSRLNAMWEAVQADPDDDRVPSPAEHELMTLTQRIAKQEADAERKLVGVVWGAATQDDDLQAAVKAAQWMLERQWPTRWSSRMEVTGANGGPLEVAEVEDRRTLALEGLAEVARQVEEAEKVLEVGGEVVSLSGDEPPVDEEVVDEEVLDGEVLDTG